MTWSDGALSEGQVRYTKEAITFADGKMKITTSKPAASDTGGQSFAENGTVGNFPLQSGEFRTKFNNYRYGRYEASIKAPIPVAADMAAGNFINTPVHVPHAKIEDWREIDIEIIAGGVNKVFSNIVYADGKSDYGQTMNSAAAVNGSGRARHARRVPHLRLVWKADGITWYIDNNPTAVRTFAGGASPPIPNKSAKIMMSMWVFGGSYAFAVSTARRTCTRSRRVRLLPLLQARRRNVSDGSDRVARRGLEQVQEQPDRDRHPRLSFFSHGSRKRATLVQTRSRVLRYASN